METNADDTKPTKVRTETRNRGTEPCSALFLGRAAAVVEGDGATILQLNVKGLTNAKLTIIEQLAYTNKVTAIFLQKTQCETTEKVTIPEFTLAAYILNKQHCLATFVRQDIEWSLEAHSEDDSQLDWLAMKVQNVTIINVYKPPPTCLTRVSLPVVNPHASTLGISTTTTLNGVTLDPIMMELVLWNEHLLTT